MPTHDDAADKRVPWEIAIDTLYTRLLALGPVNPDTVTALPILTAANVTPRGVQVLAKIYARGVVDNETLHQLAEDGIRIQLTPPKGGAPE